MTGYQLDGTDNQDAWLASAIINPNPDFVAESKFSLENFDAENGSNGYSGISNVDNQSLSFGYRMPSICSRLFRLPVPH